MEIDNWDLGAGIYISFYLVRSSLMEGDNSMTELDSLGSKNAVCRDLFSSLNEFLAVWGSRLSVDARRDIQLSCFDTVSNAPIPEDLRASHLQDAMSLFTCILAKVATS